MQCHHVDPWGLLSKLLAAKTPPVFHPRLVVPAPGSFHLLPFSRWIITDSTIINVTTLTDNDSGSSRSTRSVLDAVLSVVHSFALIAFTTII